MARAEEAAVGHAPFRLTRLVVSTGVLCSLSINSSSSTSFAGVEALDAPDLVRSFSVRSAEVECQWSSRFCFT